MMPQLLQDATDRARSFVLKHKRHTLLPRHRYTIYRAFGPREDLTAQRARGKLASLAAKKVATLWRASRPEDPLVDQLIDLGELALLGVTKEETEHIRTTAKTIANLSRESPDLDFNKELNTTATWALEAAIESVLEVLDATGWQDWIWEPPEVETTVEINSDLDWWTSEAALWASMAYAGGDWDELSDHERRKEYWLWWLDEAVPHAWGWSMKQTTLKRGLH